MSGSFLTDDLSVVFSTSDFSVTASYTPAGGSTTTITGIFDDEDLEVDAGDGSVVLQQSARFTCNATDVTGVTEGDTLVVAGTTYRIAYTKNDGTGVIELYLETV